MPQLALALITHDDWYYLASSLASFAGAGDAFVFVSRIPWHGKAGDWQKTVEVAKSAGAEVVLGDWGSELAHRQAAREHLLGLGYTHALIPDGDEIIEPRLLASLVAIAEHDLADRVYVSWDTYWHSPQYVIRPREPFTPLLLYNLNVAHPVGLREYVGGRPLFLSAEHGLLHHLSYAGPDERIARKVSTWGHREEVAASWFTEVYQGWKSNRLLRNLHPTHPPNYGMAERIAVPAVLHSAWEQYQQLTAEDASRPSVSSLSEDAAFTSVPPVSIVIPLYGGAEDIAACLNSLALCSSLVREVIVVDNASPDDAASVVEERSAEFPVPLLLLRNERNLGFAAACNAGAEKATGETLLFLNSDTIVPRFGLLRLLQSLSRSGTIGAAGAYSNAVGHGQQIDPTYTSLDTLDLFAEDFAHRPEEDTERDMLVGFCLAVRKSVWQEVGGFDTRFGPGLFEDNDLCYRIRRAGYKLILSGQSFVHHHGSRSLQRRDAHPASRPTASSAGSEDAFSLSAPALFQRNLRLFGEKWQEDVESGLENGFSR